MTRRSIAKISEAIITVLENEKELSISQIALRIKAQWRTTNKVLELLKSFNMVKERNNPNNNRDERMFSLNK